ncbi:MAG: conjugal transfer protein TraD, partial [Lachnospiraceae bacterium]|nr:conjugal transfer protein TraD [Lachnospiraceae bacterium]
MNYDTTIQSFDETGTIETSVPQEETSVKKNRKHMTPDEQIEYYKQQKEELDKKIKEAKRNLRDKERKERTRNLIRLGGVVVKYVPDATTDSTADLIQ